MVEQNALAALTLADHIYVIDLGRTTLSSPARQLLADPRVREAYLGQCHSGRTRARVGREPNRVSACFPCLSPPCAPPRRC
nr:hypothetical protein [Nonomuraea polychroma]